MNIQALSCIKWSNRDLYVKAGDFMSKMLVTREEIIKGQGLLYDTYKNQRWQWSEENNPTGFQIKSSDTGMKYITDRFDGKSSIWIGTFHGNKLITSMRLAFRTDENPFFDLELYHNKESGKTQLDKVLSEKNLTEISRFSTSLEYQNNRVGGAMTILILAKFLVKYNLSGFTTSQYDFFSKYGYSELVDDSFDYGDGVKTKVWLYPKNGVRFGLKLFMGNMEQNFKGVTYGWVSPSSKL
ncbi:uncharacterized protein [Clytia hemisphaerica]|uniref:Uncharacterized protein n=1 Tax=Clytia hemisphaerica TaxID=252671 RepID=A0A7M5X411_9CNID